MGYNSFSTFVEKRNSQRNKIRAQLNAVPNAQSLYYRDKVEDEEEEKNNGGFFGGLGYFFEKIGLGFMQGIEGIVDYAVGGVADLVGAEEFAEDVIGTDWMNYNHADDWYNPSEGWKTAGDVAGGIGTSLPGMLTTVGLAAATGGASLAVTAAGLGVSGLSAAGTSTKEAYQQTGKLGGAEFGYGALQGATEAATELLTGKVLGTGLTKAANATTAALGKGATAFAKTVGKNAAFGMAKEFTSEAFEEGFAEWISPYIKRITYDPNAESATAEEIAYVALVGGLSGVVTGGATTAVVRGKNTISGAIASKKGETSTILDKAQLYMGEDAATSTDFRETVEKIYEKYQDTTGDGALAKVKRARLLGELKSAEVNGAMSGLVKRSAISATKNAEAIAQRLNSDGRYKMVDGKLTFVADSKNAPTGDNVRDITAEDIRRGYDPSKKNSLDKALKHNEVLRYVAASDAAGRFMLQATEVENAVLRGEQIRNETEYKRLREEASPEARAAMSRELGIDLNTASIDDFNAAVKAYKESGKADAYQAKIKKVEEIKSKKDSKAYAMPRAISLADGGIRHYTDGRSNIAIARDGESFIIYDYDSGKVSRSLSRAEVNSALAKYREGTMNEAAVTSESAAEVKSENANNNENLSSSSENVQNAAETASENVQEKAESDSDIWEKGVTEADRKAATEARKQAAELDSYAKENIKDYDNLSRAKKLTVRDVIRKARESGISEADALSYARVAARTGLDIQFNQKECYKGKNKAGEDVYHAGFYDPENNRIVVNPKTEKKHTVLLIHELSHAMRSYLKNGEVKYFIDDDVLKIDKKTGKLEKGEVKLSPEMWTAVKKYYADKKGNVDMELAFDEASAYYAEALFGTEGAIDLLLGEKPTLRQKILSFFTKSAAYYSTDKKLSKEARRHFKKFKAMFDSFALRNTVNNTDVAAVGGKSARRAAAQLDSDGTELSEGQKAYFKKSKAINEDGKLLVLYHGGFSGNVFSGRGKSFAYNPNSIYLTDDYDVAKAFAKGKGVKKLYANIEKPLILDAQGNSYMDIPIPDDAPETLKDYFFDTADADNLPVYAEKYGYDGVIIYNVREGVGGDPMTEVIALSSEQVKNTDNLSPTKNPDIRYSMELGNTPKISADMTDEQRYEILKDRKLFNIKSVLELSPEMKKKIPELSSWDDINNYYGKNKKKIIKAIAREFGAIEKEYLNPDIELSFEFSNGNFNEAYKRQKHNFEAFAKMFSVFDDVVESAVGVEIHNNINHKYDPTLENVYVLMSAYQDGDELVPIKLEVKKFKDKQNTLYVAVSMEKIKMTELYARGNTDNGVTQLTRSVNISIANIFSKINPSDKSFLKYIPDGFLNEEQLRAKKQAIQEANDADYMSAVKRGDMVTAQRMVDEAADKAMPNSILREGKAINKGEENEGTLLKMYHGSGAKGFYTFESHDGALGKGVYITSNWDEAVGYALEKLGIDTNDSGNYEWNGEEYDGIGSIGEALESKGYVRGFYANVTDESDVTTSSVYWEDAVALVRDTTQLKSADPVTYDDDGNVIPLSERFNTKKSDIRYSAPISNTAADIEASRASIVMDMDKRYKPSKSEAVSDFFTNFQIQTTNAQAGIEKVLKKNGVKNDEALVQMARAASNAADSMLGLEQYRIGAEKNEDKVKVGRGLSEIMKPIDNATAIEDEVKNLSKDEAEAKREEYRADFFTYLFHEHNVDRMSLRSRQIEWMKEDLVKLESEVNELEAKKKELAEALGKENTKEGKKRIRKEIAENRKALDKATNEYAKTKVNIEAAERFVELEATKNEIFEEIKGLKKELEAEDITKDEKKAIADDLKSARNKLGDVKREMTNLKVIMSDNSFELAVDKPVIGRAVDENGNTVVSTVDDEDTDGTDEGASKPKVQPYTSEESRAIADELLKKHPEFAKSAEELWGYSRNLNQYRVDTGLITQEQFDYMQKLYPHYVPTYREGSAQGIAALKGKYDVAVKSTVKSAVGSVRPLLRPDVIIARQTMETVRAGAINKLARALHDAAGNTDDVAVIEKKKVSSEEAAEIDITEVKPKNNRVIFFRDGEKIELQVTKEIFAGFDDFNSKSKDGALIGTVARITDKYKKLVTSYSPLFIVRNMIRDLQDAGINTKYAKKFAKNYIRAIKQIAKNGEYWQLYRAMGGLGSSLFDFDRGYSTTTNKKGLPTKKGMVRKFFQSIENANVFVEQLPRLAEFMSAMQSGKSAEQALLDAADVTTNFGRGGKLVKAFNRTFVPFLNPAVQGFSKIVRMITSIRSMREFSSLLFKCAILGIVPIILNQLMYGDDEDYEKLRESDKENNFLIKLPNNTFIKIPRGRVTSVLAGLYNRPAAAIKGEDVDWGDYLDNVSTQISPVDGGIPRDIFSPIRDIDSNKTWYGTDIENQSDELVAPGERYDESTSEISKWIANQKLLNWFRLSPKQINYLVDQYTGVVGDIVLPATSNKANRGYFLGNTTIDPTTQNKLSSSFYDAIDGVTYIKNSKSGKYTEEEMLEARAVSKYYNDVKQKISDLNEKKREINNNSKLSNSEKRKQIDVIQTMINEYYKEALTDASAVANVYSTTDTLGTGDIYSNYVTSIKGEENFVETYENLRYIETIKQLYGSETALSEYNKSVYEKSQLYNALGISYDKYYDYYFTTKGIESDVDKQGNTIAGSKKTKVLKAIKRLGGSKNQQILMLYAAGYTVQDGDIKGVSASNAKKLLLNAIMKLNVSKEEKAEIAKSFGFKVKNGKIIKDF